MVVKVSTNWLPPQQSEWFWIFSFVIFCTTFQKHPIFVRRTFFSVAPKFSHVVPFVFLFRCSFRGAIFFFEQCPSTKALWLMRNWESLKWSPLAWIPECTWTTISSVWIITNARATPSSMLCAASSLICFVLPFATRAPAGATFSAWCWRRMTPLTIISLELSSLFWTALPSSGSVSRCCFSFSLCLEVLLLTVRRIWTTTASAMLWACRTQCCRLFSHKFFFQ